MLNSNTDLKLNANGASQLAPSSDPIVQINVKAEEGAPPSQSVQQIQNAYLPSHQLQQSPLAQFNQLQQFLHQSNQARFFALQPRYPVPYVGHAVNPSFLSSQNILLKNQILNVQQILNAQIYQNMLHNPMLMVSNSANNRGSRDASTQTEFYTGEFSGDAEFSGDGSVDNSEDLMKLKTSKSSKSTSKLENCIQDQGVIDGHLNDIKRLMYEYNTFKTKQRAEKKAEKKAKKKSKKKSEKDVNLSQQKSGRLRKFFLEGDDGELKSDIMDNKNFKLDVNNIDGSKDQIKEALFDDNSECSPRKKVCPNEKGGGIFNGSPL